MARTSAEMLQKIRWMRAHYNIPPSRVYNFDELRLNSSEQGLNQRTLEFASVKDPMVKKIANPKEAFTGILFANADGSELMVFLVTKKGLPVDSNIHTITVEDRDWNSKEQSVNVKKLDVQFTIINGVTVVKVPPGMKAWCGGKVTIAFLLLTLFRMDEPSILQVIDIF